MPTLSRTVLATSRPSFLILSLTSGLLGLAWAVSAGQPVDASAAALALLGALSAHAAVNLHNEWHDFRSGLDSRTRRTPFSGGSGALVAHPSAARATLIAALLSGVVTVLIGLWLVAQRGPVLLPIGALGLALVFGYTGWATRRPLACLLAPGLGFGPLIVVGTAVAAGGSASPVIWLVSLVPGALASGLLLLNQFPDVDADRTVGRRHLPIVWGRPRAGRLFALLVAIPFVVVAACVLDGALPAAALLMWLTAPLAAFVARHAIRNADRPDALVPAMAGNVALTLLTPVLLSGSLWWSGG